MIKKGLFFERDLSKFFHSKYIPVLISSKLLRRFECGQVDISYIDNGQLKILEVKSSSIGVASMQRVQKRRLLRSAALLESLLDMPVHLKIIAKRNSKFYP